jgi:hypothetical protein
MRTNRWIAASALSLGLIGAWTLPQEAPGKATAGCPKAVMPSTPQLRTAVVDVAAEVHRAVPRVYKAMANQMGADAWRGYLIEEMVSLAPTAPLRPEVRRLRGPATRRCSGRVADATWAVELQFPNAQTIPASKSVAYFVHSPQGWRFWFRLH